MTPVFVNVTFEDLYDTCVCQCYIGDWCLAILHWMICMTLRPVFVNVTLEDLYDTCVWQCYIGGFV